ncbi:hypothetical protein B296_00051904, partial [Ensete ventricosum]
VGGGGFDAGLGILGLVRFRRCPRPSRTNMRSILSRCSSVKGLSGRNGDGSGRTHLYLNVYDLTPANNYLYWFGIGVFHSGIEVHGMEYGFGAHDYSSSGVFEVEPKSCPGFIFRRSVWLGTTDMSRSEFRVFIEDLAGKYHGDTYHLIIKNCNHFTDEVCVRLTGKPIPGWVNRLARLGYYLSRNISSLLRICLFIFYLFIFFKVGLICVMIGKFQGHSATVFSQRIFRSQQLDNYLLIQLFLVSFNYQISLFTYLVSEDGSVSYASSSIDESDEEDADHHLLKKPNGDFVHSNDVPLRIGRDDI